MGEIKIVDIPEAILYTRRFIRALLKRGINKPMDYMILCMAVGQYLAILYADITRLKVASREEFYEAFPRKVVMFLPSAYRTVADKVANNRNIFCHSVGSDACTNAMTEYNRYLDKVTELINDIVMNDKILQEDTQIAIKQ